MQLQVMVVRLVSAVGERFCMEFDTPANEEWETRLGCGGFAGKAAYCDCLCCDRDVALEF